MISSGFIKGIQNEMRKDDGVDGDAQRLSQLVWLIFLKVLDDDETQKEFLDSNYRPAVPEKYRWKTWAGKDDGITGDALLDFVNNDLFPSLKNLEADSSNRRTIVVKEVFANSFNYMKNGTQLRKVINKINDIDFNSTEDRHSFGDIYETLLASLQSAGNAGEFYTPRAITKFIVEMVNPRLGEKVFDPAAGTGGFLTGAIDHIRKEVKTPEDEQLLQHSILGVEKKQLPYSLLVTNMIFHGLEEPSGIRHDNTLARPLISYGPEDFVDVIAANPPFGGSEEDGIEDNFPSAFRTRETADLFLVLFVRLLKKGGRAGIVLPDGTLFGDGVKNRIKQHLLEETNLHTIIRLPDSVFSPYAKKLGTNLLFFTKGEPTEEIWYYEHRLPEGVKAYNKTKPIRLEELDPIKHWWDNREESEVAWKVNIDEIKKRDYNLDIRNPNTKVEDELNPEETLFNFRAKWSEIDKIADNLQRSLRVTLDNHSNQDVRFLTDNLHEYLRVPHAALLLRKNILHLAISGQLVPQIPSEGTGEELYERIKGKRVVTKKQNRFPGIADDEILFDIPSSWKWVRPIEIGEINPRNSVDDNTTVGFTPMAMISEKYGVTPKYEERQWIEVKKNLTHIATGDVVLAKITPCFENSKAGIVGDMPNKVGAATTEVHVFRQYDDLVNHNYAYLWLKTPIYLEVGETKMTGTVGQKRVPTDFFASFAMPLPPLEEQKRIVAKTTELLELVAELEKYLER